MRASVRIGMHLAAFDGLPALTPDFQELMPGEAELSLTPASQGFEGIIKLVVAKQQGNRTYFKGWGKKRGTGQWLVPLFGIIDNQRLIMLRVIDSQEL